MAAQKTELVLPQLKKQKSQQIKTMDMKMLNDTYLCLLLRAGRKLFIGRCCDIIPCHSFSWFGLFWFCWGKEEKENRKKKRRETL